MTIAVLKTRLFRFLTQRAQVFRSFFKKTIWQYSKVGSFTDGFLTRKITVHEACQNRKDLTDVEQSLTAISFFTETLKLFRRYCCFPDGFSIEEKNQFCTNMAIKKRNKMTNSAIVQDKIAVFLITILFNNNCSRFN